MVFMNKFNFLLNMMYVFIVYFLFRSSKKIQIKKNIMIEVIYEKSDRFFTVI